jgi:ATP-dependent protease ClpP protease subunit
MADLVIKIREYIGESSYNWYTDEFEWATNCDDLRMAVEYAGYAGQAFDRIVLEIGNCYGGSVMDGLAMFHYLQGLNVPILTRIMGTVASMGTILPLAGDDIECASTSQFMVHAPSNSFDGTAAEIAAQLKGLDDCGAALALIYTTRTGSDAATVAEWMSKDTWLTAAEALVAGLCTSVLPLRPKAAPQPTEAQASVRRTRFAEAVARADKRTPPTPTKPAANAVPLIMPTPRVKTPVAAAKKAAQPQARKTLFQQLKDLINGADEEEVATAEVEAAADPQSTALADSETVWHDGPLVVGTSAIFNDEALTEPTPDADYTTADGQVMTVAGGICTALGPDPDAVAETPAVAAMRQELADAKAKLATAEAEAERLKKLKPALPTARKSVPNADAPDPKAKATIKEPIEGAGTL